MKELKDRNEKEVSILKMLNASGICMEDLVESALALYVPCNRVDSEKSRKAIEKRFRKEVERQCADTNVALLIEAALYLDGKYMMSDEKMKTGNAFIVGDELIGMSIAEYIGGKKALFNFVRYDKEKPGILSRLGVFLDDAVAGLVAGCMTKVFENWR